MVQTENVEVLLPFATLAFNQTQWDVTAWLMYRDDPALVSAMRTSARPVGEAIEQVQRESRGDALGPFLAAGLAWDDLVGLAAAHQVLPKSGKPGVASAVVITLALRQIENGIVPRWPDLPLRSAVGWLMTCWAQDTFDADTLEVVLDEWDRADLIEDGWLFATAGLGPGEAAAAVQSKTLDASGARLLAGLRGAVLPAN